MVYFGFYAIVSCSIYINNNAILIPGKSIPTRGVSIEGKYDDVMLFSNLFDFNFISIKSLYVILI